MDRTAAAADDVSADTDVGSEPVAPITSGPLAGMTGKIEQAAELLRAIGSAHRLMILCLLSEKDHSVGGVCEATGMRQSLASQHLARLRQDGLVKADRRGHFVHYSLANDVAREIVGVLHRHFCPEGTAAVTSGSELSGAGSGNDD